MATAKLAEKSGQRRNGKLNREQLFEIIDGKYVEVHVGVRELGLAHLLAGMIRTGLGPEPPGEPFVEMIFRLKAGSRKGRRPDLAFVSYERWPDRKFPDDEAWEVVPRLMAEIVSKNNSAEEIQTKIIEYFASGVEVVWVVFPRQRQILVYTGPKTAHVLDADDTLDCPAILPGFSIAVRDLLD